MCSGKRVALACWGVAVAVAVAMAEERRPTAAAGSATGRRGGIWRWAGRIGRGVTQRWQRASCRRGKDGMER